MDSNGQEVQSLTRDKVIKEMEQKINQGVTYQGVLPLEITTKVVFFCEMQKYHTKPFVFICNRDNIYLCWVFTMEVPS